jgi:NIPSNAP protein
MASSDRFAATAPAVRLFEWRTYVPAPGGAGDLVRRLRRSQEAVATAGLLRPLGLWIEEIGSPGLVSSLWSFPGLEAREQALASGEFQGEEGSGQVLDHVESVLWRTTGYSPEPAVLAPVIEVRTYDAMPGRLQAVHDRFATFTVAAFARHGFENCGYWTEYFGRSGRLVYIVGFSSLEHRERAWRAFGQDPAWHAARQESERDGPLIERHGARILRSARRQRPAPPTRQETQEARSDAI